jgi:hypothetical protein
MMKFKLMLWLDFALLFIHFFAFANCIRQISTHPFLQPDQAKVTYSHDRLQKDAQSAPHLLSYAGQPTKERTGDDPFLGRKQCLRKHDPGQERR